MDKRLARLIKTIRGGQNEPVMLDTYNQAIHEDVACTIRTNINTANHHFIMEKIAKVGTIHKGQSGVVYGQDGIAPTITTNKGDGQLIAEPVIGALRGRNPENPNERGRSNGKYKQRLEINEKGTSNTITSVQKDNVVVEPIVLGWTRDSRGKIVDRHPVEVANCVTAAKRDNTQNYVVEKYRIRKLTERECFRLMGVRDEDSDKIRAAVSKSQCYKLAGNSIVVDVMVRIFDQLLFGNKNKNQQLEIF
jgi:DNA (cytosine-5)-methyltransferase 1